MTDRPEIGECLTTLQLANVQRMGETGDWGYAIDSALSHRRLHSTLRSRRPLKILDSTHVEIDSRRLINFSSNNYLGLTHHPRVMAAFESAVKSNGVGSGAAALITGQSELHASAERALARWKGTESAVVLNSGYAANLACVQMLAAVCNGGLGGSGAAVPASQPVRFLVDKLAHASLIDAVRSVCDGSKITFRVFPHNHLGKLRRLLSDADRGSLQVVVTESIFSMDGDAADLAGIAELKKEFPFLLLLDEAHGSGVYGPDGAGYAAECGLGNLADLTVVTLSKAIGCSGGAVCATASLCEAIVNFGRPYIFSTAIPPAICAAVEAAIGVMRDEPNRRQRVRELARQVRTELHPGTGDSPIIPIILGDESIAIHAAEQLLNEGILAVAVRPPTVARGTSRLRITLSCDHTDEEIRHLIATVARASRP
jgi:8-amino-7-oxononanoate synthase